MNQAQGGNAELHDRTGLLLAIAALFVSGIAAGVGFMAFISSRDQVAVLKDQVIKLEGKIDLMELKR